MAAEPIRQPKAQVTVSSLPDETQVVVLDHAAERPSPPLTQQCNAPRRAVVRVGNGS